MSNAAQKAGQWTRIAPEAVEVGDRVQLKNGAHWYIKGINGDNIRLMDSKDADTATAGRTVKREKLADMMFVGRWVVHTQAVKAEKEADELKEARATKRLLEGAYRSGWKYSEEKGEEFGYDMDKAAARWKFGFHTPRTEAQVDAFLAGWTDFAAENEYGQSLTPMLPGVLVAAE